MLFVMVIVLAILPGEQQQVRGALFQNHKGPLLPSIGKEGGLLARSIMSNRPTETPTPKPTEPTGEPVPTGSPTESPAPSPSPSDVPTADPDKITPPPTSAPTESPAPSPSPSNVPTSMPSSEPTKSASPSGHPSSSPSSSPSASPSAAPSDFPSMAPSSTPSYSPTRESYKTKTAITSLLLEEIPSEMDYLTAAEFELVTLEFLKKKITLEVEDGHKLDLLAVNVLSQTLILPDPDPAAAAIDNTRHRHRHRHRHRRHLESETWSVALEVNIRTVSVVIDGRVPESFNFTKVVDYGFYDHWDQYLWQLGNTVEFFSPLVEVSDWKPQQTEDKVDTRSDDLDKDGNNASFAIAILFSLIALGLAICASYIAIRKHMRNNQGRANVSSIFTKNGGRRKSGGVRVSPKNSPMNYSGPDVINYLTKTMSFDNSPVDKYHDGDAEGGGALAFIKNINVDIEENTLEAIALSPHSYHSPSGAAINHNGLFVVDEESDENTFTSKNSKNSSSNSHRGTTTVDKSINQESMGLGGQIRKWLTPRQMRNSGGGQYSATGPVDTNNNNNNKVSSFSDRHDPPEKQSTLGYNYGKDHNEPDAVKASTKNKTGVYTSDKSTVDGLSQINNPHKKSSAAATTGGQFTLPISFFSNHRAGTDLDVSGGDDSPMSSLADSNASSFFAVGNTNKAFTGRKSSTEGVSLKSGEIDYSPNEYSENHEPTSDVGAYKLPKLQEKQVPQPPAVATKPTTFLNDHSIMRTKSTDSDDSVVKRTVAQYEGKEQKTQPQIQHQQQQPLREIQPVNHTSVGIEMTLGATSRDQEEERIHITPTYQQSRSVFSPTGRNSGGSTCNPPNRPAYGGYAHVYNKKVQHDYSGSEVSTSTLGARPMERMQEAYDDNNNDDRTTLSNIMNHPGSYVVYAPSGQIGIVVDTSKEGPSVHSLKSTSPMLGLISPGDLIVALDGEDTRNFSAAALTRLMAKKSRQKERKIMLYSQEGF